VRHVDKVLQLLKEQQLYAKPSKCFFGVKEVEYLGHMVSHEGVKVDPNKIKAMMDWPIPKTLKNLRGFLGLTGYYHKFGFEWWYNTSFHTTIKMTPFMALYGYHPPSITSSLNEKSKVQVVEDHIENKQQVLQILKDNLTMAHNCMKQQADQHRSEIIFEVGDWVFLRLQM
jgi:hypothetical protein